MKSYLDSLQVIQETKDYKIVKIYKDSINDSRMDSLYNFSTGDSYKTKENKNYVRTKLLQEESIRSENHGKVKEIEELEMDLQ